MAIILIKNGQKIYKSQTGIVTDEEKKRANELDATLKKEISNLENQWINSGVLTKTGIKKDSLKIWYDMGTLLNNIIDKYNIRGSEEETYFWQTIYSYVSTKVQKLPPPQKYKEKNRNHFRLCAKMAEWSWEDVRGVGNWSVWRDLFDNSKLMEDERVFKWVVNALRSLKLGHKEYRPFIHATRKRLKKIDTSILNNDELWSKLDEVKEQFDEYKPEITSVENEKAD